MTSAAHRIADKKDVQGSTGPKTEAGKAIYKLDALLYGRRGSIIEPVLFQEDTAELDARIRQWVEDMRPGDAAERDLVVRAAKTSFALDRLERGEADERARRLQEARGKRADETAKQVGDLGGKLLAVADPRTPAGSGPPRDDHPEILLRGLEGSADGCRWLLDRWAELKQVIGHGKALTHMDLYRWVRLQGKQPIDAIYDPDLNRQLLAWEALVPDFASGFWERCHAMTPPSDHGFGGSMRWREIVAKPASEEAAIEVVAGVIAGRIARLKELIALHEEIAREEARERAGAAWFDPGPEAEGGRKRRSTLTRELRQLIELILKMQAARERRVARDEPRRRGGRGEEKGRPDGIREASSTEGTEERGPAPVTAGDRAGRERTETKPPRRGPMILPGAPGGIVEGGMADEIRALARAMSGGRPDVPISVARKPDGETNEPASSRVRPAIPA